MSNNINTLHAAFTLYKFFRSDPGNRVNLVSTVRYINRHIIVCKKQHDTKQEHQETKQEKHFSNIITWRTGTFKSYSHTENKTTTSQNILFSLNTYRYLSPSNG